MCMLLEKTRQLLWMTTPTPTPMIFKVEEHLVLNFIYFLKSELYCFQVLTVLVLGYFGDS
ncbi:hypothetical protein HanRHA438_Chr13g0625861 [Helianthus annuus]|nr:hypothetical protein HanRHA438_Chr13g0625861 [Helianthus annuus]